MELMNAAVPGRTHFQAQLRQHRSDQEKSKNDLVRIIALLQ